MKEKKAKDGKSGRKAVIILSVVLAVIAGADMLMLLPLAVSLRQRLKEIEGGEEDEAVNY